MKLHANEAGAWLLALLVLGAVAGCDDMSKERKQNPYRTGAGDPAPVPPATVPADDMDSPPPRLTLALIERGQSRFRAFCTPCHSELGDGHGMIVQRGFSAPPSYHIDRLRQAPTAHFFDVMTNGYGAMYSFAQRVSPDDRWAIAAYIRALQRSETATVVELTPEERTALAAGKPGPQAERDQASQPWTSTGIPPR